MYLSLLYMRRFTNIRKMAIRFGTIPKPFQFLTNKLQNGASSNHTNARIYQRTVQFNTQITDSKTHSAVILFYDKNIGGNLFISYDEYHRKARLTIVLVLVLAVVRWTG